MLDGAYVTARSAAPGNKGDELLRVGEVARLLGVHPNTVRHYGRSGELQEMRVGPRGDRRYRRADVEAFASVRALLAAARTPAREPSAETTDLAPRESAFERAHERTRRQIDRMTRSPALEALERSRRQLDALRGLGRLPGLQSSIFAGLGTYSRTPLADIGGLSSAGLLGAALGPGRELGGRGAFVNSSVGLQGFLGTERLGEAFRGLTTPSLAGLAGSFAVPHELFTLRMDKVAAWTTLPLASSLAHGLLAEQAGVGLLARYAGAEGLLERAAAVATRSNLLAYERFSGGLFDHLADDAPPGVRAVALSAFRVGGSVLETALWPARVFPGLALAGGGDPDVVVEPTVYAYLQEEAATHAEEWAEQPPDELAEHMDALPAVRLSRLAGTVNRLWAAACRGAQQAGRAPVFQLSTDAFEVAANLPTLVVAGHQAFVGWMVGLHKYLVEASADGTRIEALLGTNHPTVRHLQTLRHVHAHDPGQAKTGREEQQRRAVGRLLQDLCGTAAPYTAAQWHHAQIAILERVRELLDAINTSMATTGSPS